MKNVNSFAKTVKEEIVSHQYKNERLLAMISSFTRINGVLSIRNKKERIVVKIENPKIAKFIYKSIQDLFHFSPSISYLRNTNLRKSTSYLITINDEEFLKRLHINFLDSKIAKIFMEDSENIGGYLSGAFLASGSVNSPHSSNYHLEISLNDKNYAKWLVHLMNRYKNAIFNAKISSRRDKYIIYLKRSDQIVDFLVLIGATEACLYFENTRISREFSNISNRQQNLDISNLNKTINRAKKDIEIINKLIKKKGLVNIGNEKMVLLASLRLANKEASLDELAILMSKELHTNISKSNVNHLLRAIRKEN